MFSFKQLGLCFLVLVGINFCLSVDVVTRFTNPVDTDEFPNNNTVSCDNSGCAVGNGYKYCLSCCNCRCNDGSYWSATKKCVRDSEIATACLYSLGSGLDTNSIAVATSTGLQAGIDVYYCPTQYGTCTTIATQCSIRRTATTFDNGGWKRLWQRQDQVDMSIVSTTSNTDKLKWNSVSCTAKIYEGLLVSLGLSCRVEGNVVNSCLSFKMPGSYTSPTTTEAPTTTTKEPITTATQKTTKETPTTKLPTTTEESTNTTTQSSTEAPTSNYLNSTANTFSHPSKQPSVPSVPSGRKTTNSPAGVDLGKRKPSSNNSRRNTIIAVCVAAFGVMMTVFIICFILFFIKRRRRASIQEHHDNRKMILDISQPRPLNEFAQLPVGAQNNPSGSLMTINANGDFVEVENAPIFTLHSKSVAPEQPQQQQQQQQQQHDDDYEEPIGRKTKKCKGPKRKENEDGYSSINDIPMASAPPQEQNISDGNDSPHSAVNKACIVSVDDKVDESSTSSQALSVYDTPDDAKLGMDEEDGGNTPVAEEPFYAIYEPVEERKENVEKTLE
eukprot:gene5965-6660_t